MKTMSGGNAKGSGGDAKRFGFAIVLVVVPFLAGLWWWNSGSARGQNLGGAMWVLTGFLVALLALLQWAAQKDQNANRVSLGYLQVTVGADGRVSTSKTIGALWTLTFATALVVLTAMVWFGGLSVEESFGDDWDSYLLLLGGPFAAAVLAKGITANKVGADPTAKTSTAAASGTALPTAVTTSDMPRTTDLVANDAGETSLADTQYVVFSFVALLYFLGSFIRLLVNYASKSCADGVTTASTAAECVQGITLPQIPPSILGLTSLAALTYVGNKAVQTSGIRFAEISPNPVSPGGIVTIKVVNLTSRATRTNTSVIFKKGDDAAIPQAPSGDIVRGSDGFFSIPVNAPPEVGEYSVTVMTPETVSAMSNLTVK